MSPGVSVPGTLSITASEVYFEVDEDSEEYKNIDPKVGPQFFNFHSIYWSSIISDLHTFWPREACICFIKYKYNLQDALKVKKEAPENDLT